MTTAPAVPRGSRLSALLEHFSAAGDPRDVRRIQHTLPGSLLLVVCGTKIGGCGRIYSLPRD